MANLPTIADFLAGYGPQQSDMQSLWTGPLGFFQQRVVFRAVQANSPTTIPSSGSAVAIGYDTILEDPYGGWNATNHTWVCPAGLSGWYQVCVTASMASPGNRNFTLFAFADASNDTGGIVATIAAPGGEPCCGSGSLYVYLAGTQDFAWGAVAVQNASSNQATSTSAGSQSQLQINWIMS